MTRNNKQSPVTLKGYIIVPVEEISAIKKALSTHIELTRQEPGCLAFEVTQDRSNPAKFHVHEVFIDQKAFQSHQSRIKTSDWGALTTHVQRHYQITEIDDMNPGRN